MKQTLLIITFLLSGYLQNFAQNYETFVTEMKKLEQEEKEYSGILFRKNDHSAEYKKGFEPKLKKVREENIAKKHNISVRKAHNTVLQTDERRSKAEFSVRCGHYLR